MLRSLVASLAVLGALCLVACGRGSGATPSSIAAGTSEEQAAANDLQIEVILHGFRDANIYLKLGGSRQRLGMAGGNRTATFKVPWNAQVANALQANLIAERIGDDSTVQSDSIQIIPGARVVWTLNMHFNEVSLEIY